jgi:hypothetical protein
MGFYEPLPNSNNGCARGVIPYFHCPFAEKFSFYLKNFHAGMKFFQF